MWGGGGGASIIEAVAGLAASWESGVEKWSDSLTEGAVEQKGWEGG